MELMIMAAEAAGVPTSRIPLMLGPAPGEHCLHLMGPLADSLTGDLVRLATEYSCHTDAVSLTHFAAVGTSVPAEWRLLLTVGVPDTKPVARPIPATVAAALDRLIEVLGGPADGLVLWVEIGRDATGGRVAVTESALILDASDVP
jgi:hypothetical protein